MAKLKHKPGERFFINPMTISVGSKTWMNEHVWKIYHKACKERGYNLTFVEPFCGSAASSLFLLPESAWLNDLNPHLINFYRYVIKYGSMPDFSVTDEKEYYEKRSRFNEKIRQNQINDDEMAQLFYYLNKAGYGGLSRYNSKGEFNVPFRGNISNPKTDFSQEQEILKDWKFTCLDWEQVLYDLIGNDSEDHFLFVDPPYYNTFNKYVKQSFDWDSQVSLANYLAKMPNPILATNSSDERIVELYTDLGFDVQYRLRGNMMQRPKVKNGVHKDFKEAVFSKNIKIDNADD